MEFEALEKLFKSRRSIRKWKTDPVSEDLIVKAIESACWSPNSGGKQPYHCYLITSPVKIKEIGAAVQEVTDYLAAQCKNDEDREIVAKWQKNSGFFRKAPVLIAVTASIYISISEKLQLDNLDQPRVCEINRCRQIASSRIQSVGAFIDHLLLAFHVLGLGAVWMAGPVQAKSAVEKIITVGPDEDFVALIPVGYPDEEPKAPARKPLEKILSFIR